MYVVVDMCVGMYVCACLYMCVIGNTTISSEWTEMPHQFTEQNRQYSVPQSYTVQCAHKYEVSNAFGPCPY